MRPTTVRSGGVDLAVFECGNPDGPPVLLVHGWPDTHALWGGVVEELVADFRVVSYDLRGMGQSGDPGDRRGFAVEHLGRDLLRVAEVVSPDRPVHVVAHDWGSVGAWEAVCEPDARERIASFTTISGPCLDHSAAWLRRQLRRPSPRGLLAVLLQFVSLTYMWFFMSPLGTWFFRRHLNPERWAAWLRRSEGFEPVPGLHADTLVDDAVSGLRFYRANVPRIFAAPRERRTTVPVLQLVTTKDLAIRPSSLAESARWTQRLTRVDIPYGHWVAVGHPGVVAVEVKRFVEAQQAIRDHLDRRDDGASPRGDEGGSDLGADPAAS